MIFLRRARASTTSVVGRGAVELDHEAVFLEPAGDGAREDFGQVEFAAREDLQHGDEAARGLCGSSKTRLVWVGLAGARAAAAPTTMKVVWLATSLPTSLADDLQPVLLHRLLPGDGGRALFLRGERGGFRRAFDDDLLGLRIMFREPVAAVVERRAVRIDFRDRPSCPARAMSTSSTRMASASRICSAAPASVLARRMSWSAVLVMMPLEAFSIGTRMWRELAGLEPREGFLHRGAFAQRRLRETAQRRDMGEASRAAEIAEAQGEADRAAMELPI